MRTRALPPSPSAILQGPSSRRAAFLLSVTTLFLCALLGCTERTPAGSTSTASTHRPHSKIKVTTTTTMVSDLVQQIGGDRVVVQGLMGPGVDPHLYKAAANDVTKMQDADVIFYSGLLLEGKLQDVFAKLARTKKFVYPVSEAIPREQLLEPPAMAGHYDPHIWFDVTLWRRCVEVVVSGLSEFAPHDKSYFTQRGADVKAKMEALHQWAVQKAAELPQPKRILVTSHDAYNYFGRAYGFQVVGLQGISTVDEVSLAAMVKLVEFIKKNQIKAIFVESSVPPNAIRRISEDAGVRIGGELFSDAMGTPGQMENGYDLGTYEGMVKHNLSTIVNALK